jgi:hypothetical protein
MAGVSLARQVDGQRDEAALNALQGPGDSWFVGGYTRPSDSQETALLSAIEVTQGM